MGRNESRRHSVRILNKADPALIGAGFARCSKTSTIKWWLFSKVKFGKLSYCSSNT